MSKPKVSVLTTVYNTADEYLRECIESVLNQTFTDFEFIILDNGSNARIAKTIATYDDPRIKFFRIEKNIGPAAGRNFCIERARGEYLAILDSDDVALPDRLAVQVEFLDTNPEIGAIGTFSRTMDDREFFSDSLPTEHDDIRHHLMFHGNMFCHSSVMIRRAVLDAHNIQYDDARFPAEDYDMWLRLAEKTRLGVVPIILTRYRHDVADGASRTNLRMQNYQAAHMQLSAIARNFGVNIPDIDAISRLYAGDTDTAADAVRGLRALVAELKDKNLDGDALYDAFRGQFKYICYHAHSPMAQWRLMTCPGVKYFGLGPSWRVFCFVTRGIFGGICHATKR